MAIGPSYFLRPELDEEWVKLIWEHAILPYIEEQLYGEGDRLSEFQLSTLRGAVTRSQEGTEDAAGDAD